NAHQSDQKLWDEVRNDSTEAFGEIYRRYLSELYRYGMTIHPDKELIGDAIQELFIDLWAYRNNLSKINQLKHYLLTSLRSKVYKLIKKNTRKIDVEAEYKKGAIQFLRSAEDILIEADNQKTKKNQLVLLINELPELQRESIMLIFFEGKSYEETSRIMAKSIQNVYTLVSRGVSSLRNSLK
ncbi:unnamed protein product, partial [Chrysoparadoxa australica]